MTPTNLKERLKAAIEDANKAELQLALLAMVILASAAREQCPEAAYVLLAECEDESRELWVQAITDAEHNTLASHLHTPGFDPDPVAYHMHPGNQYAWLPFMAVRTEHSENDGRAEYSLTIDDALAITLEDA